MSTKIKQEDGTEVEMFSAQELEVQRNSAVDVVKAEAAATLSAKEAELTRLKDKEMNFGRVKEGEEAKAKEIEKLQGEISSLKNVVVGNFKNDLLKKYAGSDIELAKTIEKEYLSFNGEAVTNDEITARMEKAAKIAGVQEPTSFAQNAFGSMGSRGVGSLGQEPQPIAKEVKEVGAKMGISEEDYKKYGNKVK